MEEESVASANGFATPVRRLLLVEIIEYRPSHWSDRVFITGDASLVINDGEKHARGRS